MPGDPRQPKLIFLDEPTTGLDSFAVLCFHGYGAVKGFAGLAMRPLRRIYFQVAMGFNLESQVTSEPKQGVIKKTLL